jgi:predicted transcriptional regulator
MLYPDQPKRRDQAYYLTEKGLQLLREIEKEKK